MDNDDVSSKKDITLNLLLIMYNRDNGREDQGNKRHEEDKD